MGWDFVRGLTKKALIAELSKESLAHCVKGNVLWAVKTSATGNWIACYLLGSEKEFGWGYKGMDESVHPYYYTCPLSYLERAPVACEEWRERVRQYHARLSLKLKVGDRVKLVNTSLKEELTVTSLKPLRAQTAQGKLYRLPRRFIGEVLA